MTIIEQRAAFFMWFPSLHASPGVFCTESIKIFPLVKGQDGRIVGMIRDKEKRTIQVNVRMTEADLQLIEKAAELKWPDVEVSLARVVLSLARLAAKEIVSVERLNNEDVAHICLLPR